MLGRSSTEIDEDEVVFVSEKKLKMEREFAAGPSNGIPLVVVANTSVVSSKPALPKLSETVTKKNFNKMILESGILDGKWALSQDDIIAVIKKDIRFKQVVKEKLESYKSQPANALVFGLKRMKARIQDEFSIEQKLYESKWNPGVNNLNLSKETFQLQPLLDQNSIDGYCVEAVHAGGVADVVLTKNSTQCLTWSERLLLPVYLSIEAKSSFLSHLAGTQRSHTIHDLDCHPNCAAFISFYQYDSESIPRLFAVILAKKIESLLGHIKVANGLAQFFYTPTLSKTTGLITNIRWNDDMRKCAEDKDVLVRTINDFTAEQLENPGWVVKQFIAWADLISSMTVADFQTDSLATAKGNVGEELTSIAFHCIVGTVLQQGETITHDKIDLLMRKGGMEVSISCKTISKNGSFDRWMFPLKERLNGKKDIPVTFSRSCDVWTATLHYDLIEPNLSLLKPPDGTHWIIFIFTKEQLRDRLGNKTMMGFRPGEHLHKAIYFDSSKKILNPESIDRLIVPLFQK